jgi:hypothetical protein
MAADQDKPPELDEVPSDSLLVANLTPQNE